MSTCLSATLRERGRIGGLLRKSSYTVQFVHIISHRVFAVQNPKSATILSKGNIPKFRVK